MANLKFSTNPFRCRTVEEDQKDECEIYKEKVERFFENMNFVMTIVVQLEGFFIANSS